tara:strand:- start:1629 stop:1856 length:228 start_codon:yes stop_codon:yes gene_type:complete
MKKIIHSQINRMCIDVPESNIKNGQALEIWKKHGGDNQKWIYQEDGTIVAALNKKSLSELKSYSKDKGYISDKWK